VKLTNKRLQEIIKEEISETSNEKKPIKSEKDLEEYIKGNPIPKMSGEASLKLFVMHIIDPENPLRLGSFEEARGEYDKIRGSMTPGDISHHGAYGLEEVLGTHYGASREDNKKVKLTNKRLQKIIKEEIRATLTDSGKTEKRAKNHVERAVKGGARGIQQLIWQLNDQWQPIAGKFKKDEVMGTDSYWQFIFNKLDRDHKEALIANTSNYDAMRKYVKKKMKNNI